MEEKLLKLFKLADLLSEKQNKIYAQITYCANNSKNLEITIISKRDFLILEKCKIQLEKNSLIKLDNIINLLNSYIGGVVNE